MSRWMRLVMSVAAAIALSAQVGCGGKKRTTDLGDERGGALGEESLGGSLAAARAGKLGSQAVPQGPLGDIHFAYDSFDLDELARATLQEHASWLREHSEARVEIEGHCDDRGTIEYNLALGAKRAAAAKSYLSSLGIAPERITTISYGEELPLCQDATESCWQRNRRGHFVVIGD